MEHPEERRLRETAERMITFVSEGDADSFRMLWNSLTVTDQRMIVAALLAEVADLRRGAPVGARRPRAA